MGTLPTHVRLVIFDLDGVVYRGAEPILGAADLVDWLHAEGVLVRFATNNSMVARARYVERLAAMGIRTVADEIVTSTSATVAHLAFHAPEVRSVLVIGAEGMHEDLAAAGLDVVMAGTAAPAGYLGEPLDRSFDAVIVGLDPHLDYQGLAVAMTAVAFGAILESSGVSAADAVVIGDNPAADVVGAHRAGCAAILVLTGVASAAVADRLDGEERPDAVAADPAGVRRLLEGRLRQ